MRDVCRTVEITADDEEVDEKFSQDYTFELQQVMMLLFDVDD